MRRWPRAGERGDFESHRKGGRNEGSCVPRARAAGLGVRARPDDPRADGRDRPDRLVHDLRHRPAHPQGRRARGEAGDDPRPRGRRHGRRGRRGRDDDRAGRPRARLVHHLVRALPLLQGGPLRPLHRRRRLDLRPPDRRPPGGVRPGAVRRHLRLQGAGRAERRAGALPRRHPSDGVRGRRAQRARRAGRHGRHRRRGPDRARGDHDREAAHARARSSRSTSPTRASRRRSSSAPTSRSTTAARTRSRR